MGRASLYQRTGFGDVAAGDPRVMVAHDQGADEVIIHGVRASLGGIDKDLRDERHDFIGAT